MKYSFLKYLVASISIFFSIQVFSQGYLLVEGKLKTQNNPLSNASIKILSNNKQIGSQTSSTDGKFQAQLPFNNDIILEISKTGLITQRFRFNTKMPADADLTKVYKSELTTDFFPVLEGVDISVFNQPIASFEYDLGDKRFVYDTEAAEKISDKIMEVEAQIENILKNKEKYDKEISVADGLFKTNKLPQAKESYLRASAIIPSEKYPKDKIAEIDKSVGAQAGEKQAYENAIAEGDNFFNAKTYDKSKAAYQKASGVRPAEKYPKDRIAEIDKIQASAAATANVTQAYNAAIEEADKFFTAKTYDKAKESYTKAIGIKKDEIYPKDRAKECDKMLAQMGDQKKNYDDAIAEGDKTFGAKNYDKAKESYQKASGIKPEEKYPKDKIAEINKLIAAMTGEKQAYESAITEGDNFFNSKTYDKSKAAYQKAVGLKPVEKYPKDRIVEIDKLLADLASKQTVAQAYTAAITEADKLFAAKTYDKAKDSYNKALGIKKDEVYPKDKIKECDKMIAQLGGQKKNYDDAIAEGDKTFGAKNYDKAKESYQKASGIKPEEKYPKDKIKECDKFIADIQQQQNAKQLYETAIADADKAMKTKEYATAKAGYQNASRIKPVEQYPKDKITEIDKILAEQASKQTQAQAYSAAIADGDKLFAAKTFDKAKESYQKAGSLKPDEKYPKEKIAEIEKLQKLEGSQKQQYDAAIAEADKLFGVKDYEKSKTSYQKASDIKPSEQYPKTKITEIDKLLGQLDSQNKNYSVAIADGDKAFKLKDYAVAKAAYQKAGTIKVAEQYPKDKISEIDKLLGDQAAQANQKKLYDAAIAEADKLLAVKTYDKARNSYQKASGLMPGEKYPKDKIAEIDKIIAASQGQKQAYDGAIAEGDKQYAAKIFDKAKDAYQKASNIKPEEKYPKDKIAEITKILADAQKQDAQKLAYDDAIIEADKAFKKSDYVTAKTAYQKASGIKAMEPYPKEKIKEIDKILADSQQQQLTNTSYNIAIAEADKFFKAKDYTNAKTNYTKASTVKPAETYPKDKIKEIDNLLADQAGQAARKAYDDAIAEGDKAYKIKEFAAAKIQYEKASVAKPTEQYPKDKIKEITTILADLQKQQGQKKAYNDAILEGDKLLAAKDYDKAKESYQKATNMKSTEQYPKDKINEIAKIQSTLQLAAGAKQAYDGAIADGDRYFATQDWEKSKDAYTKASGLKPSEQYPKDKISQINKLAGEVFAQKQKLAYETTLADADKLFESKQYDKAKAGYQKAVAANATDPYPKNRISEINNILSGQSNQKLAYSNALAEADKQYRNMNWDKAKEAYDKASKMSPIENYPKNQIKEIDRLIADSKTNKDFYDKGYIETVSSTETVKKNQEKKFKFSPYRQRKSGSYVVIKAKNLGKTKYNAVLNYGQDIIKNGGFSFEIAGDNNVNEYTIRVSSHGKWISEDNNWLTIIPVGGDIEVTSVKIYFGDGK